MLRTCDRHSTEISECYSEGNNPLQYPFMPALQVGSKSQSVYLPVENCLIPGRQRYDAAKLSDVQRKLLNQCRQVDTSIRLLHCMDLMHTLDFHKDQFLNSFGLDLSDHFVQVPGRLLPAPVMEYKRKKRPTLIRPVNGTWEIGGKQLVEAAACSNYSIVSFLRRNRLNKVAQFCRTVAIASNNLGMRISTKADMLIPVATANDLDWALDLITNVYKQRGLKSPKYLADVKYGVATYCFMQDVLSNVVHKHCAATATKVGLTVNLNMGGINTRIAKDKDAKTYLVEKYTQVLGVYTMRVDPKDKKSPLVRSMVGNTDTNCVRYEASVKVELCPEEAAVSLELQFRECFMSYRSSAGQYPAQVILFVVNVPEKMFQQEIQRKMEALLAAWRSIGNGKRPNVTIVAVIMNHTVHFAVYDKTMTERGATKAPVGTVVGRRITSADGYDYYICSSADAQESGRFTKYHVLYDENKLNADVMQLISYYLCYLGGCTTRSITVPAPAYFSYLACKRAKQHLEYYLESKELTVNPREDTKRSRESLTNAITVHDNIRNTMYFA
uniref:Piwi domain-containing protein n=1 Tax=Trichuris muris TaxID=70415 RepID=A0A5S6QEG9_TRIMR